LKRDIFLHHPLPKRAEEIGLLNMLFTIQHKKLAQKTWIRLRSGRRVPYGLPAEPPTRTVRQNG
jgi:hypothetical protein